MHDHMPNAARDGPANRTDYSFLSIASSSVPDRSSHCAVGAISRAELPAPPRVSTSSLLARPLPKTMVTASLLLQHQLCTLMETATEVQLCTAVEARGGRGGDPLSWIMSGRAGDRGATSAARFTGCSSSDSHGVGAGVAFRPSLSDPGSAAGAGVAAGPASPLQGGHACQAGSGAGPCSAAAMPPEWGGSDSERERRARFRSGSAPATPTSPQPQAHHVMSSPHQPFQQIEGEPHAPMMSSSHQQTEEQPQIQPSISGGAQVFAAKFGQRSTAWHSLRNQIDHWNGVTQRNLTGALAKAPQRYLRMPQHLGTQGAWTNDDAYNGVAFSGASLLPFGARFQSGTEPSTCAVPPGGWPPAGLPGSRRHISGAAFPRESPGGRWHLLRHHHPRPRRPGRARHSAPPRPLRAHQLPRQPGGGAVARGTACCRCSGWTGGALRCGGRSKFRQKRL